MTKTKSRKRNPPKRFTPSTGSGPMSPKTPATSSWEVTPIRPRRATPLSRKSVPEVRDNREYVRALEDRLSALENASFNHPHQHLPGEYQPRAQVIASKSLPLYNSVGKEIQEGVENGEFIDMHSLTPSQATGQEGKKGGNKPLTPLAWARSFIRLSSELVRQDKADVQDLFIHMDNVLGLAEDKHKWDEYDTSFRAQQVNAGYSYGEMRVELYARAVTAKQPFRQNQFQQRRPFQGGQLPLGSCYRFHTPNQRCEAVQCQYQHTCPICGGRHPRFLCARVRGSNQGQNAQRREPAPAEQQKQSKQP